MPQMKELLVEALQDLLHAETQLTRAIPQMANAAKNPKLKEVFEKHLLQTEEHAERLKTALASLGGKGQTKPCKGMMGLIEEGQEVIEEGQQKEELLADLALIAAAQKVEHYEISSYGTAKSLAKLIGEIDVAKLLTRTLGEEESADYLLTEVAKPIAQQATLNDNSELRVEHHSKTGSASAAKTAHR